MDELFTLLNYSFNYARRGYSTIPVSEFMQIAPLDYSEGEFSSHSADSA